MKTTLYPLDFITQRNIAWSTPGICPLAVANKLKAVRELRAPDLAQQLTAEPRLAELLWFLQWHSHQPGGLDKFVQEFLIEFPERLRNRDIAAIPRPRSGHYSLEDCVRLWGSLPCNKRDPFMESLSRRDKAPITATAAEMLANSKDNGILECAADIAYLLGGDLSELRKIDLATHRNAARVVAALTPDFFWQRCCEEALLKLPAHLSALCSDLEMGFGPDGASENGPDEAWRRSGKGIWFFDGLIPALLEAMERHAMKARGAIATTTVSKTVLDKFEFALEMHANVLLAGDPRLGKSVTVEAECRMRPGRCRLVTVPPETSERDFLEAHAKPLYWSYDSKTPTSELKAAVKHIITHSGVFVAYDEFHHAIPARPRRNGSPPRLDWIRCNVVDRKRGVLFCTTRQGYHRALSDFLKDTKWAIEQWAGRLHDITVFGADAGDADSAPALNPEDILAIAAHKFPNVDSAVLEEIASEAYDTNTAPHTVETILFQACWIARKAGRSTPTAADARQAIQEWKSQPAHEAFERRSGPPAIPAQPKTPATARPVQVPRRITAAPLPPRGKKPAFPVDSGSNRLANGHALETV